MRKIHLALFATVIAAVLVCGRPAAAQSDSDGGSIATVASSAGGQSGGSDQTSSSGAQSNAPSQRIGAGPSGPDGEGPIQKGSNEFEVFASGGAGAPATVTKGDGLLDVGVRYGRVMTRAFMPGIMRGYFESAWDVMPVFEVYQPGGAVYGFAVDTVDLKWVHDVRGPVVPYWEFTGGLVFSRHAVPEPPHGSTAFNFMPQAAAGVHIFSGRYVWSAEIRLVHISNAGIREPNDGITAITGRISFGEFRPPHHKEKARPAAVPVGNP